MAYIAPDSELQFFQNLNIDPDYENTLYFATTIAKDAYFDNLATTLNAIKCEKCYYTREQRGYCRVERPLRDMLNRNYMRFRNKQFENKWFYAFVLDVEYINNITTEVHFQIDVQMTWMGSYTIDQCFVERNHTLTDAIGDNIVPEGLEISRLIANEDFAATYTTVNNVETKTVTTASPQRSGTMGNTANDWEYIIVQEPDQNDAPAGDIMGFYSGLNYVYKNTAAEVTTYLATFPAGGQDRILGIFYVPKYFHPQSSSIVVPVEHLLTLPKPTTTQRLDEYKPKNNKLYTYPYNFIRLNNSEGDSADYPFENFTCYSGSAEFLIRGIIGEQSQISCSPQSYNSQQWSQYTLMTDPREVMIIRDFPMCAWTIDTFRAYLAQQMVTLPASLGASAAIGVLTGGTGAGFAANVAGTLVSQVGEAYKHFMRPKEARGNSAPQLSLAGTTSNRYYKDFWFYRMSVRYAEAKRIDDYFTMFGYAINDVRQPSIHARPHYTYVKTIGCHISGSIPADHMRQIENNFNRGIRFWTNYTEIGDYTVDNSPGALINMSPNYTLSPSLTERSIYEQTEENEL